MHLESASLSTVNSNLPALAPSNAALASRWKIQSLSFLQWQPNMNGAFRPPLYLPHMPTKIAPHPQLVLDDSQRMLRVRQYSLLHRQIHCLVQHKDCTPKRQKLSGHTICRSEHIGLYIKPIAYASIVCGTVASGIGLLPACHLFRHPLESAHNQLPCKLSVNKCRPKSSICSIPDLSFINPQNHRRLPN